MRWGPEANLHFSPGPFVRATMDEQDGNKAVERSVRADASARAHVVHSVRHGGAPSADPRSLQGVGYHAGRVRWGL